MAEKTPNTFTASTKLYGHENVQVYFTISLDTDQGTVQENISLAETYLEELFNRGYTVDPKNLAEGAEIMDVAGYVLGWTSRDEPCLHLYSDLRHLRKFKFTTVWWEEMQNLPLPELQGKSVDELRLQEPRPHIGSAPERETAEKTGMFVYTNNLRIVMEPEIDYKTGEPKKTDQGNLIKRFSHVYGQSKPDTEPVNTPDNNDSNNLNQTKEDDLYANITGKLSPTARKFVSWGRNMQSKYEGDVADHQEIDKLIKDIEAQADISSGIVPLCVLSGLDAYDIEGENGIVRKTVSTIQGVFNEGTSNSKYQTTKSALRDIYSVAEKEFIE